MLFLDASYCTAHIILIYIPKMLLNLLFILESVR